MKSVLLIACLSVLAACSDKAAAPVVTAPAPVVAARAAAPLPSEAEVPKVPTAVPMSLSADAIGPVRFGMTLAQAEAALGEKTGAKPTADCMYVRFKALPDVHLMVENGLVMRADIKGTVQNITGMHVGGNAAALRAKYPQATIAPHKYVQGGHDLRIAGSGKSAMIIEDDGKNITGIRGGLEPAVSYVEGCS